ncbi:MAG TPA: OmpH family outer membrane protein [Candidatus Kapabacteria bacterium]|nr:OmpH family outer membrane protein [Candidatus Kapabacteria bacterium]
MNTKLIAGCAFNLLFLMALHTPAASQARIGFIDATRILKQMPEAMDAESHLNQFVAQWNKEVNDMLAELSRKQNDYDRKKLIMSDAERSASELDLSDLKKRIDQFRQSKYGPSGELASQQESLMKPAYDKLAKALEDVALDGKYDFVFDKSSKELALLYTNAKFDLTNAVAKKLGIETNDVFSVPLLNGNNKPGSPAQTQPGAQQNSPANPNRPAPPAGTMGSQPGGNPIMPPPTIPH